MKKILYLIPLFLLFLIPKSYALPNCSLVSNATLYDVNSSTNVSSISTYKDSEFLCNTIHTAYGTSDRNHGLGWSVDLTTMNSSNSFYQLDVFMYTSSDSGSIDIVDSVFRGNTISVGTSNPSSLWINGVTNISNLDYTINYYYDNEYGRTYYVLSYVFKANSNFNKIFIPFATSSLRSGNFDLIGLNLTNTGQSSLTSTEINSLLSNQTSQIQNDIDNMSSNIEEGLKTCTSNLFNINSLTSSETVLDFSIRGNSFSFRGTTSAQGNHYVYTMFNLKPYTKYFVNFDSGFRIIVWNSLFTSKLKDYESNSGYFSFNTGNNTTINLTFYANGTNLTTYSNVNVYKSDSYNSHYTNYGETYCVNKIDETNNKLDDVNSSIKDTNDKIDETNNKLDDLNSSINDSNSSGATNSASGFFNNFQDNDFGLSGIITAPLNTIKTITNNSCTPLNLTIPFVDKEMSLPCMTDIYEEHFGSFLDIYQIITFGIISYWVCVQIYAMVKGFKNPDKDEIEVMDL